MQCTVYSPRWGVTVGLLAAYKTLTTIDFIHAIRAKHAIRVLPIGWNLVPLRHKVPSIICLVHSMYIYIYVP